jgi:hypothetical protein
MDDIKKPEEQASAGQPELTQKELAKVAGGLAFMDQARALRDKLQLEAQVEQVGPYIPGEDAAYGGDDGSQ